MTREQLTAKAEATLNQGMSVRARLLEELDDLEHSFRRVRETVEALPPDTGLNAPLSPAEETMRGKVRRTWKLWNK